MKTCIPYLGGKHYLAKEILKFFPVHNTYVEVFGGGASVLIQKDLFISKLEVYNDINSDVVNFFRVLRNKKQLKELIYKIENTPYSREEFYNFRKTWKDQKDLVERVYRWFIVVRIAFGGHWQGRRKPSFGYSLIDKTVVNKLSNVPDNINEVAERFKLVQIENLFWEKIVDLYDSSNTLFYLDPPYVNRIDSGYKFDFSLRDHVQLINKILNIEGKVIISGYRNRTYERLEKNNWRRIDFESSIRSQTVTKSSGKKERRKVVESIWISPNCDTKLKGILNGDK